jgi:hypothetical protein
MYLHGNPVEIQDSNTREHNWPQHDSLIACVIAQQYTSATLVSLRFYLRKVIFGARLKRLLNCEN